LTPCESKRIRIVIADDHPALRAGIAAMLGDEPDMELVGEASNGREAVAKFRELRPDIILMDVQMPELGGIDALVEIRGEAPDAHVIMLTTYPGDAQAVCALKAGSAGYMLKSSLLEEVVDVIRVVAAGGRHVDAGVAAGIARHVANEPLSPREVTVLGLVGVGLANKEIARRLGITEETVKAHMKSIFAKLGVGDRTHAVTEALRRGVMDL
jgi:DNA-binding NarL/FixJ family response regulator